MTPDNPFIHLYLAEYLRIIHGLLEEQASDPFTLGFRLQSASEKDPDRWRMEWLAVSRRDPSLQIPIKDYWSLHGPELASFHRRFGKGFRQALLLQLGHAARIYPLLWEVLLFTQFTDIGEALERHFPPVSG